MNATQNTQKKYVFTQLDPEACWDYSTWYFDDDALFGKDNKNGIVIYGHFEYMDIFKIEPELEAHIKNTYTRYTFDAQRITQFLTHTTHKKYTCQIIHGYCQDDWNYLFYPVDDFSWEYKNEIEAYYFGAIDVLCDDEHDIEAIIPHYERDYKAYIKNNYIDDDEAQITLRLFDGYIQTPKYREV